MGFVWGVAVLALTLPAVVPGEVVRLKDGSTLKGKLVRLEGDTLTVRLNMGAPIKVHRSLVEWIAFSDSASVPIGGAVVAAPAGAAPVTTPAGTGTILVKFEDRNVTSKITIDKKQHWDEKMRSNHILVEFVVDGQIAYSAVDSTMDKTIYKGVEKEIKNDAEFADFEVSVPAGRHRCSLVVRNRDVDTFRESFDPAPISTVLDFDEITIDAGGIVRLDIKMDKGFLKTSSPKLYRANTGQ
jgi:hypothetical protein